MAVHRCGLSKVLDEGLKSAMKSWIAFAQNAVHPSGACCCWWGAASSGWLLFFQPEAQSCGAETTQTGNHLLPASCLQLKHSAKALLKQLAVPDCSLTEVLLHQTAAVTLLEGLHALA